LQGVTDAELEKMKIPLKIITLIREKINSDGNSQPLKSNAAKQETVLITNQVSSVISK